MAVMQQHYNGYRRSFSQAMMPINIIRTTMMAAVTTRC
jgi:hypothetical protein